MSIVIASKSQLYGLLARTYSTLNSGRETWPSSIRNRFHYKGLDHSATFESFFISSLSHARFISQAVLILKLFKATMETC